MNKRMEPYSLPDDRDISALFDAQNVNLPTDLDQQILSQARRAVQREKQQAPSMGTAFRPWFAAAAVAMIAIGIAPQLLQSPESALDTTTEAALAPTPVLQKRPATEVQSRQAAEETSASSETEAMPEAIVRKVVSTPPQPENSVGGAAGDVADSELALDSVVSTPSSFVAPSTLRSEDYRLEPTSWIQEMRRLEAQDMPAAARFEYDKFRQQFPDYKTDYRPQTWNQNLQQEQQ